MTASLAPIQTAVPVVPIRPIQEKVPEYHCASCTRCQDKHCDFYDRYVEGTYNRCWNHTNYIKDKDIKYVSPPLSFFKEIQRNELRKIKELQSQNKGFI